MNHACFPKEKHQNSQKWAKFMNVSLWPFLWFGLPGQLLNSGPVCGDFQYLQSICSGFQNFGSGGISFRSFSWKFRVRPSRVSVAGWGALNFMDPLGEVCLYKARPPCRKDYENNSV